MYYLLLAILYPIALLPLRVLYVLSDILFVLVYYVFGYRRQVVTNNFKIAFPQKTEQELRIISRKFYRSFCDQWVEMLTLLTMSETELNKRITGNWKVLHELAAEGRNTYLIVGHSFNWEWANLAIQYNSTIQQFATVYMPTENSAVDRLIMKIRTRGGGWMISMKAKKALQKLDGIHHILGLVADQNPSNLNSVHWIPFMNRDAPFFKGTEQIARRAKGAVVFMGIRKVKRGYYKMHFKLYTKDASLEDAGAITKAYASFLEEELIEQPENWMWTHKRWKHTRPA